jgi:hypothetical protein
MFLDFPLRIIFEKISKDLVEQEIARSCLVPAADHPRIPWRGHGNFPATVAGGCGRISGIYFATHGNLLSAAAHSMDASPPDGQAVGRADVAQPEHWPGATTISWTG